MKLRTDWGDFEITPLTPWFVEPSISESGRVSVSLGIGGFWKLLAADIDLPLCTHLVEGLRRVFTEECDRDILLDLNDEFYRLMRGAKNETIET